MSLALGILPELLELAVFVFASAGLSLAGLYIERFALASAQSGQTVLAVWAIVVGGVVLFFAYFLASHKAASSYAKIKGELAESPE